MPVSSHQAEPQASVEAGERGRRNWLWKSAVSILLMALLFWTVSFRKVLSTLLSVDPLLLGAAAAVQFLEQGLTAVAWTLLLRARNIDLSLARVVYLHFMGVFVGTLLPSSSGTDVVRTYYLARTISGYEAVGSMLVLRLTGLLALGMVAVVGIQLVPSQLPWSALVLVGVLIAMVAFALALALTDAPGRWASALLGRLGLPRLARVAEQLHQTLVGYRRARGHLLMVGALALLVQLLRIITTYYAARALGATLPLRYYLALVPVVILLTLLPVSAAGLGVREGSFVFFFTRAGMTQPQAMGTGLLVFALHLLLAAIGGVLYWRDKRAVDKGIIEALPSVPQGP
ncbi:MAG: lysylphosphatidylglycerol synthase transmembrane domain-containing protein [Acidobacteriota bacterium]